MHNLCMQLLAFQTNSHCLADPCFCDALGALGDTDCRQIMAINNIHTDITQAAFLAQLVVFCLGLQ